MRWAWGEDGWLRWTLAKRSVALAAACLVCAAAGLWTWGISEGGAGVGDLGNRRAGQLGRIPHPGTGLTSHQPDCPERASLESACRRTAGWLAGQIGSRCQVVVRSPFVLAGDLSAAALADWHDTTIDRLRRATTAAYFATSPGEPVTILLFSSEPGYRDCAARLFGDRCVARCGHYRPHLRVLLVNLEAGPDALPHELTHALMAFDFPQAPAWLREGLASLHERARVREDGTGVEGLVNRRLTVLQDAIRRRHLPPLRATIAMRDFQGESQSLLYAQARYFCMYLQERHLLEACYRSCRAAGDADATGEKTVREALSAPAWEEIDADFRAWAMRLRPTTP